MGFMVIINGEQVRNVYARIKVDTLKPPILQIADKNGIHNYDISQVFISISIHGDLRVIDNDLRESKN